MKVHVDFNTCDKHGQCVMAAPTVFWFDDEEQLQHRAEIVDDEVPGAEDAELLCPVQAITLERDSGA